MKLGWCVEQLETGLYDGWYFLDKSDQQPMLEHWNKMFPEYTHKIVTTAPAHLDDFMMINHSAEYGRRVQSAAKDYRKGRPDHRIGNRLSFSELKLEVARTSMKTWVRVYQDEETVGVETNATDERYFWTEFSAALKKALEGNRADAKMDEDYLLFLLMPHAFEVVAQLRGYKTQAVVTQIVTAGKVYGDKSQTVFESVHEPKAELKAVV